MLQAALLQGLFDTPARQGCASAMSDRLRERRSFEAAKAAVDADLAAFKRDVARQLTARPPATAGTSDQDGVLESLLALASKCLEEDMASFRTSIQEVVDELGEVRRKCVLPGHKALVTRLLFILTRCSRLVLSEDASSSELLATPWGTAPRGRLAERLRRLSGVPLSTRRGTGVRKAVGSGSPRQTPIYHAATLPPRMLRDMAAGLQGLRLSSDGESSRAAAVSRGEALGPYTGVLFPLTESPAGATPQLFRPAGDPFADAAAAGAAGGGGAETPGMAAAGRAPKRSPLGRSVVTALEAQLDQG
ncbi:hypothetical protein WJX81_003071 [Elliptochloris bilobata]|uniref:IREH1/IRE-like N-terminal domain-containing protein n=1 Tax=Elliptochloris bilobata TaxID=381761 RepID=A0AAW1RSK6_9CHLO